MNTSSFLQTSLCLALVGAMTACGGGTDADTARTTVSSGQAAAMQLALGDRLLDVDLDRSDADLAVLVAYGMQAAADLGNDAPVLVHGRDARLVAATADRMAAAGYSNVLVVTR